MINEAESKITGTLNHVDNFRDFNSLDPSEQSGNYLYLSFKTIDADSITTKITGGKHDTEVDCTKDKWCLYYITEACKAIVLKATKGDKSTTKTYDIDGLVLSPGI